ncbi:unnamed protein product, partial [Nesidiocoris tenuis]
LSISAQSDSEKIARADRSDRRADKTNPPAIMSGDSENQTGGGWIMKCSTDKFGARRLKNRMRV